MAFAERLPDGKTHVSWQQDNGYKVLFVISPCALFHFSSH